MLEGYRPPQPAVLHWLGRSLGTGTRCVGATPLPGGITAHMDRVTVETPTGRRDVVLRRWPDDPWADGLVEREADALAAVEGHGVPAPQLLGADPTGAAAGVRCTLTTALPGEPDLAPSDPQAWLEQLAAAQAAVHAVPARLPTRWRGWYAEEDRPLEWIADPGLRAAARAAATDPSGRGDEVLVHGDYQHFNVLWRAGRLTGVVDWPNAATGDRGSDVGHCRLNLAVLFDADRADEYLRRYERAAGAPADRCSDLRALLCFDAEWQQFIPHQVAGRAPVDVEGMADRVTEAVRRSLDLLG